MARIQFQDKNRLKLQSKLIKSRKTRTKRELSMKLTMSSD